ncbi:hypothetical protein [Streptomyces sp. NBC_01483]|uniref:hypothetical protein n=1 Tax=Streptomyces sp. NBC_01483 TaxID=2903883 RepID=UPI002E3676CD|nr:hypothetical protein [Streptomyces sp. NBC_01483]
MTLCIVTAAVIWAATGGIGSLKSALGGASPKQITVQASGAPPWRVSGYGWTYTVESVTRTTSTSLTITAYVERSSASGDHPHMLYQIAQDSGRALDFVPFEGDNPDDKGTPPVDQRRQLVYVVGDTNPRATHLTITLHDFYWPDGQDLVLKGVRAPSRT